MKLTPEIMEQLKTQVETLAECIGAGSSDGYGLTIENNSKIWHVHGWSLDSFAWTSEGFGRTFEEAWDDYVNDVTNEELEEEWWIWERERMAK